MHGSCQVAKSLNSPILINFSIFLFNFETSSDIELSRDKTLQTAFINSNAGLMVFDWVPGKRGNVVVSSVVGNFLWIFWVSLKIKFIKLIGGYF